MTPQQAIELLPCAHCGGAAEFYCREEGYRAYLSVLCGLCGAQSGEVRYRTYDNGLGDGPGEYVPPDERKSEAAERWNRRAPAPTEPAVGRDGWVATKEGLPLPESYARILYEGWKAQSGIESTFDEFVGKYGYFLSLDSIGACWQHARGNFAIRAALATPASPAVPGEMRLTEPQMRAIAKVIARRVAQNASVAPELCFAPALFALQDSFGAAAVQAVPAPAPLAPMEKGHPVYDLLMLGIGTIALQDAAKAEEYTKEVRAFLAAPQPATVAMHRLICQLASLSSCTPEAVNFLVEEAKRVMGQDGGAEGGDGEQGVVK